MYVMYVCFVFECDMYALYVFVYICVRYDMFLVVVYVCCAMYVCYVCTLCTFVMTFQYVMSVRYVCMCGIRVMSVCMSCVYVV